MRGLQNEVKRKALFKYCRDRADIVFLQETHCVKNLENKWAKEWGGEIIFSNGESNARGVCIMFKKDFKCEKYNIKKSEEGRFLICEIKVDETMVALCNIYGPNKDDPSFFVKTVENMNELSIHKLILGDFNTVLSQVDRMSGTIVKKNSQQAILNIMNEWCLKDVWRERHPDTVEFSWSRINNSLNIEDQITQMQASRIDYLLTSTGVDIWIDNIMYVSAFKTDHRAMFAAVNICQKERGRGYWKFNNTLLNDNIFVAKL